MTLRRQPSIRRLLTLFSILAALVIMGSFVPVAAIDWGRICDNREQEIVSGYQYARALIAERLVSARRLAEQVALQPQPTAVSSSPSITVLILNADGALVSSSSGRTLPRLASLLPHFSDPASGIEVDDRGTLVAVGVAPRSGQWVVVALPFTAEDLRAIRDYTDLDSSFFAGQTRVLTTLKGAHDASLAGTVMPDSEWRALATQAGRLHWGYEADLSTNPYLQVQVPLYGLDGSLTGAFVIGRSWGDHWALLLQQAWVWLAIAGACILLIVLLTLALRHRLLLAIERLQHSQDPSHPESTGLAELDGLLRTMNQLRVEHTALAQKNECLSEQLIQAQTLATLGQLAAGVAHDLNNPLTTIMGLADIIPTSGLDADTRRDLTVIRRQAERSGRIVRGLLTFARRQRAEPQWVALNDLIMQTLELLTYQARVSNIRCESDLDSDLPLTWADPSQMQQVLFNLMNNAMQAMSTAHGRGMLRVESSWTPPSAGAPHGRIAIRVIDDGPGLAEEVLQHLFQPYFTTKEPGAGTGLGLAIARSVVQRHSGRIWAENRVEGGAVFCVELPVTPEPPQGLSAFGSTPSPGGACNILLADSDPQRVSQLARVLRRQGHFLSTAGDGLLARSKMEMETFDLVLCGLQMSRLDGPDLYDWARAQRPEMISRFIFLASGELNPETEAFLQATRVLVLWPPFQEDMVNAIIAQVLHPNDPPACH